VTPTACRTAWIPYPANAANAFDLREAGADASFGTADDVLYTLRQTAFSGTGVSLRINEGTLGPGSYRFSVTPTLQDPAGNALDGNGDGSGGDAYQRYFTVAPPVGYQIEHSGVGPQAPLLELTEDPAGSGLAIGRALGRLDPAYYNDYSDLDVWRIELEKDDRVSISVDSPASTLYPSMWLYDPAGTQVASDEYRSYYGLQGYGPDYDAFISNYQVQSSWHIPSGGGEGLLPTNTAAPTNCTSSGRAASSRSMTSTTPTTAPAARTR
jgi:hypothetical protein